MIQQPNTRSNKYNHLDKVFNANYFAAIKAGYNPALAGAAAFAAVRNVLFNRVYGYGKTKTLVESGFESNDDDNLLHDYRLIVDNTPENPWPWFPGAPNDPFHWQTKTVLEYREKVYSALKYLERKQAQAQPRQMPACRKPGPPARAHSRLRRQRSRHRMEPPIRRRQRRTNHLLQHLALPPRHKLAAASTPARPGLPNLLPKPNQPAIRDRLRRPARRIPPLLVRGARPQSRRARPLVESRTPDHQPRKIDCAGGCACFRLFLCARWARGGRTGHGWSDWRFSAFQKRVFVLGCRPHTCDDA